MKKVFHLLLILLIAAISMGQHTEFPIYSNGLIYSDTTMGQLRSIVDSLNLQYRMCELDKTYYSKCQAKAIFIELKEDNIKEAIQSLENNISLEEFISRYPNVEVVKDLVVIKYKYKNYKNEEIVEFETLPLDDHAYSISFSELPEYYDIPVNGKWIFDHYKSNSNSKEKVKAFYFTTEFESQPLTEKYARLVQYSDCMVDTSSQIFIEFDDPYAFSKNRKQTRLDKFMNYIHKATDKPVYNKEYEEESHRKFFEKYQKWEDKRWVILDKLSQEEKFSKLIDEAVIDALKSGGYDEDFESYVERYYSKEAALQLKRQRQVIGFCSMDNSPRIHAMNIAILSAETINWQIFLRAHLDIMNDRFERYSDGSYAWEQRETYIRELEELDIDVNKLLMGITIRIENPSKNHYYGSINRLGRALAESKYTDQLEEEILSNIMDPLLDDYNRLLFFYLFDNYNYYLKNVNRKKVNLLKLKVAKETLPNYISGRLTVE